MVDDLVPARPESLVSAQQWKLSPADKDAIRSAYEAGTPVPELADRYDVSTSTIYKTVQHTPRRVQPARARVTASSQEQRPYRDSTHGYVPSLCGNERCGQSPPRGEASLALVVYGGQVPAVEVCSWHCLSRHAIHRELAGGDAA